MAYNETMPSPEEVLQKNVTHHQITDTHMHNTLTLTLPGPSAGMGGSLTVTVA